MFKTIVIGDVHGCYEELAKLLGQTAHLADEVLFVGDLICKGPSSRKTLELVMSLKNASCVLGNHEYRFLQYWKNKKPNMKPYDQDVIDEMGKEFDAFMRFIDSWPLYLDKKEFAVVHAGVRPGIPLK